MIQATPHVPGLSSGSVDPSNRRETGPEGPVPRYPGSVVQQRRRAANAIAARPASIKA